MNETTKISESVRKKVLKIMELAMLINDSPTEQELIGNKPTIFVELLGHISKLGVHIAPEGWFDDITTDETAFYDFGLTENEGIEAELDGFIKKLGNILAENAPSRKKRKVTTTMSSEMIRFTVELDSKGFTIEGLDKYSRHELRLIMDVLPGAVREVKKEHRRQTIARRLMELETKPVWTMRESLFYARYSPERDAYNKACDRFNIFKEMEVSGI